jgi:hypothetical protein
MRRVSDSLDLLGDIFYTIGKFIKAKAVMEEAYDYLNEIYDPEHPLVLEAGGTLVQVLGRTGDHYDAERLARICYDSLTRLHLDPESYIIFVESTYSKSYERVPT